MSNEHSLDESAALLPEEEQLYREFELYVRTFVREAVSAVREHLDEHGAEMHKMVSRLYVTMIVIGVLLAISLIVHIATLMTLRG